MFYHLSYRTAKLFLKHNLIDAQHVAHLQYKLETIFHTAFFVAILVSIAIVSHLYIEIVVFSFTAFLFRRRMGGYHAPNPWICQLLSLITVILMIFIVGPLITTLSTQLILCLCIGMDFITYVLPPAYPVQLHFTEKEILANIKRKNQLLALVFIIQLFSMFCFDLRLSVYSFLGLTTTVLTVVFEEINIQRKGQKLHERI